jgi:hypothetical protein
MGVSDEPAAWTSTTGYLLGVANVVRAADDAPAESERVAVLARMPPGAEPSSPSVTPAPLTANDASARPFGSGAWRQAPIPWLAGQGKLFRGTGNGERSGRHVAGHGGGRYTVNNSRVAVLAARR